MAENKKGFVLYADLIHTIEKMPVEKAGELFLHILNYVNDKNPTSNDLIINLTFEPIKQQLKRDLKKWEKTTVERSKSGHLGGVKSGEARKQKKANEANASNSKQNEANEAVNVNVTVNDNDIHRQFKHLKITFTEYNKLIDMGYEKSQIENVLDSIENYKKNTNYTSLYLTAVKWLKKEYPTVSNVDKCPYTEIQLREVKAQMASGYGTPEWFDKKWENVL